MNEINKIKQIINSMVAKSPIGAMKISLLKNILNSERQYMSSSLYEKMTEKKMEVKIFAGHFTMKGASKELCKFVNENKIKPIQIIESRNFLLHTSLTLFYQDAPVSKEVIEDE